MRTVEGPSDVKPGDLVEYREYSEWKQTSEVVTVVRTSPTRLTFRTRDGVTKHAVYVRWVKTRTFRTVQRRSHHNFRALEPRDLWLHQKPALRYTNPVMDADGVRSIVVVCPALAEAADREVVHDEIDKLAVWMAADPSKSRPAPTLERDEEDVR